MPINGISSPQQTCLKDLVKRLKFTAYFAPYFCVKLAVNFAQIVKEKYSSQQIGDLSNSL